MKKREKSITHKIMSTIPSKDTKPEILLRKALWRRGYRYRKNYAQLPGKPDIVFTKQKLVVFCDGDFWHGHNWAVRKMSSLDEELLGYSEYWRNKILCNIERDKEINKTLNAMGWTVIRIWESDIINNLDNCVKYVLETLSETVLRNYDDEFGE